MASGWYIALFKDENTVEVIPSNWLVNFGECVWPKNFGPLKISAAIRNSLKPSADWEKCPIKILNKSLISDFQNATTIANKAQFTSDCESLAIVKEPTTLKRKRIQKKKEIFTSSSDEELLINKLNDNKQVTKPLPDFPQIKKNNGNYNITIVVFILIININIMVIMLLIVLRNKDNIYDNKECTNMNVSSVLQDSKDNYHGRYIV